MLRTPFTGRLQLMLLCHVMLYDMGQGTCVLSRAMKCKRDLAALHSWTVIVAMIEVVALLLFFSRQWIINCCLFCICWLLLFVKECYVRCVRYVLCPALVSLLLLCSCNQQVQAYRQLAGRAS
jgi:hypothetical protein